MRVVITGHLGTIGRGLVRAFQKEGHEVYGMDKQAGADCRHFFRHNDEQYDVAIHCAGVSPTEINAVGLDLMINAVLDIEFLQWAERTNQTNIIYLSGSNVYPEHLQAEGYRLRESDVDFDLPGAPASPLGWAEFSGEYAAYLAREEGLPVKVFRPFEVYGEGWNNAIGRVAARINMRQDPLVVYADNNDVRDLVHISDVVEAIVRSIEIEWDGTPTNLCRGVPVVMQDVVDLLLKESGWEPLATYWVADTQSPYVVGDPLKQSLLWIPRATPEEVLPTLIKHD